MTASSFSPDRRDRPIGQAIVVSREQVPERSGTTAFWAKSVRSGDWALPRLFRAVCFMANLELDLTAARVASGTSRIEVICVMGSITILVPLNVRVECGGEPVLGSFEVKRDTGRTPPADAPLIVVTGTALMASVDVKVIDPLAPDWLEKLRARWASITGVTPRD